MEQEGTGDSIERSSLKSASINSSTPLLGTTSWRYCKEVCQRNPDLMKSFPDACKHDADLQALDTELKTSTEAVLNTLSRGNVNGFHSIDCLTEVSSLVCGLNSKIVNAILGLKSQLKRKGKGKSNRNGVKKIKAVVTQYISNSKQMLEFYSELDKFLKEARYCHFHINHEVSKCEMEFDMGGSCSMQHPGIFSNDRVKNHYSEILKKVKDLGAYILQENFGTTEKLFQKIECLIQEQHKMLGILTSHSEILNKKRDHHHAWKKAVNIIFIGTVVALIICAVVTTLVIGPPAGAAAAFVTGTSPTILSGQQWVLSLFDRYEETLKAEDGAINLMENQTSVNILELGAIKHNVRMVGNQIDELLLYSNFAVDGQVQEIPITQIKENLRIFIKKIEDLEAKTATNLAETSRAIGKIRMSMNV